VNTAAAKAQAANIRYIKVTTQPVSTDIIFAVQALGGSHVESREAVAGMSVGLSGICDFFPAAVALNDADPNDLGFTPPAPGTLLTLHFNQGTGNTAVVADRDFILLEVPDINGNGTVETALLTAGIRNFCKALGDNIHMTPSSNPNNGPRNAGDGINTRFGIYANGYGNQLQPGPFPSDTNVLQTITAAQYADGPPIPNNRRMIVAPIIAPGTYPAYTTNILDWGVFFIRTQSPTPNGNCDPATGCGSMLVEYVSRAQTGFVFGSPTCGSNLTTPVLYK